MRTLQRLDGPCLIGEGTVGDLQLSLPGLLFSTPPHGTAEAPPVDAASLEPAAATREMWRGIRWVQGGRAIELSFPVGTPEVTGGDEAPVEMGPRVLGVRTPLSAAARTRLEQGAFDLVVWMNARAAFTSSEGFVREAIALREGAGPGPLLWAPRVALPGRLAFLYSLGIDLLDLTEGLFALSGREDLGADVEGLEEDAPPDGDLGAPDLDARARKLRAQYQEELSRVRRYAMAGRLRELVETRLGPEPRRGEMLRYFDELGEGYQESHTPVTASGIRPYTTKEALRRPMVQRYRRRFLERYTPLESRRTLLLVPCSKTKPYARSPSHRRIARALEGIGRGGEPHWMSVTSPLGLVPRELECVPPARNYDIPVTGAWDEDERRWVRQALEHLLHTGTYRSVLVHLPREEYAWLEGLLPSDRYRWTVEGDSTTSAVSLGRLADAAREIDREERGERRTQGPMARVREELRSLARFQFGAPAGDRLFDGGVRLMGRPWFQRLVSPEHEDLATWKEESGLWRLTVPGARKVLGEAMSSRVQVRGGVELKGDLFAPGVIGADPGLRIGDEAILVRDGEVLGVGESRVPGPWMGRLPRGLVVKVRHRAHGGKGPSGTQGGKESALPVGSPVD